MEFRMEELKEFKIAGYKVSSTNENMQGMKDCPAFWGKIIGEGKHIEVANLIDRMPFGLLGLSVYNTDKEDPQKFDYYIAAATTKETPKDMCEYTVPACTWAVFPTTRENSGKTQFDIVTKWAPQSDYELINSGYETGNIVSGAPDIEVHSQGDEVEIWVAVRKK